MDEQTRAPVAPSRAEQQMRRTGWVVFFAALLLYWATIDTGLQPEELRGGDLITHQYAQVQARPSNAPGYPLYTMGGWLWFHTLRALVVALGEPWPNPLPLLSSYSTLWALGALGLLYRILCRLTRTPQRPAGDWPLAALLTCFYGVTYFFWYYATTTEQYSSAIAQTLAILYLYLLWQEAETARAAAPQAGRRATRLLLTLALLCGLSLAHMLTVAFIVPPLVLLILWQAPHLLRAGRVIGLTVIAAALPLLSYLYVYWRGAAHPAWWGSGEWSSPQAWFWSFVSTAQGREELGWGFEPWCTPFANGFPALIGQELTWPVVILGTIGLAWLGRRLAVLCYATLLIYLAFAWAYRCGNWFQVILPAYPLFLLGLGLLLHTLSQRAGQRVDTIRWLPIGRWAVALLLLGAIGWRLLTLWPATDSRQRSADSALDRAAHLLARPLPLGQPLFAAVDDALALQYLIHIWQMRPDLRVVSSPQAATLLADGVAIYSTWDVAPTLRSELPGELAVTQHAFDPDWIRFGPASAVTVPITTPSPATPSPATPLTTMIDAPHPLLVSEQVLNAMVVPGLLLHRYQVTKPPLSPLVAYRAPLASGGPGLDLLLIWQTAAGTWPDELAISVRLTQGGALIEGAQIDRTQPATGLSAAQQGLITDPYHFADQAGAATAADGALLILYRTTANGFENVALLPLTWE